MSEKLEKNDIITELLNLRYPDGYTLLHHVAKSGDVEFAEMLISRGCNVNAKINDSGDPPLALAVCNNQLKMVKILLDAGADFRNDNFSFKRGPLHIAANYGHLEIVKLLIEYGADVNALDRSHCTPLFLACGSRSDNCYKVMKLLIAAGASIMAGDDTDVESLLFDAANFDNYKAFDLILSTVGENILSGEGMAFYLLKAAVDGSSEKVVARIVQLGYDVNVTDEEGNSCLHVTAVGSQPQMIKCLFKKGAMINLNNEGWDPLCCALQNWGDDYRALSETSDDHDQEIKDQMEYSFHMESFNLLLTHGSNVNHVTNDGKTPLYIVLENYKRLHSNLLRILLKKGARLDFVHPAVIELMNRSNGSKFPHLLLRHEAMFEEAQNRMNGPINFDVEKLDENLRQDFARCQAELELMRETKIGNTNVTFLKLLVNQDIGPFARNEHVVREFDPEYVSSKFPIYRDLVVERFSREVRFQKLLKAATDGLARVMNWDRNANIVPLAKIVNYLDNKDLTKLSMI